MTSTGAARSSKPLLLSTPWVETILPREELAVHPKKIKEVEEWLLKAVCGEQSARILLLSGPAGSGKTACIRSLAAEMGLYVKEWINPSSYSYSHNDWFSDEPWRPSDTVKEGGQAEQFREFCKRVNKYGSVAEDAGVGLSLLLVEDLPNTFYRDPAPLHDTLRRYVRSGRSPAVFILSDSPLQEHSAKCLFPSQLSLDIMLSCIQFNQVAPTLLTKALTRLRDKHSLSVSTDLISNLASAARGDIRTAVNALQFCAAKPEAVADEALNRCRTSSRGRGRGRTRKNNECAATLGMRTEDLLPAVGSKDANLLMFRAIGKVLYCKRSVEPPPPLPAHLQREERSPALTCPEFVLEHCCLSPTTFLSFLHHNYTDFVPSVDASLTALRYLTHADILLSYWSERDVMQQYGTVGVRGLMHAVTSPGQDWPDASLEQRKRPFFRPLTAPVLTEVKTTAAARRDELRGLYRRHDMSSLTTLLVPFCAKIENRRGVVSDVGLMVTEDVVKKSIASNSISPSSKENLCSDEELDYLVNIEEILD